MKNWIKHQSDSPKVKEGIARVLREVPEVLVDWLSTDTLSIPSDTISDLTLLNSTLPNSTRPKTRAPKTAIAAADADLKKSIRDAFQSKTPFTNYAKENTGVKQLVAKAKRVFPDDPGAFVQALMGQFLALTQSGDKFWKDQPFLPSVLNSLFDRVAHKLRDTPGQDAEWVDKVLEEA